MSTAHLVQGYTYRGRILIHAPSYAYSDATVREKLRGVGFEAVTVWDSASDLPVDWPPNERSDPSGFGNSIVFVEARWGKPTGDYASSGDKWEIIDYWTQAKAPTEPPPIGTTCMGEGYPCFPEQGYWFCCDGFECKADTSGVYGGGQKCFPIAQLPPTRLNEPGTSWIAWGVGIVVVGAVGYGLYKLIERVV